MSWVYLLIAGLFEMGFTTSLKLTQGFTKMIPTISFFACMACSFWFLNKSIETIPLGIAYAIWTAIGAAGTVVIGVAFFNDYLNAWQIFFLCTLIASIFGLKYFA